MSLATCKKMLGMPKGAKGDLRAAYRDTKKKTAHLATQVTKEDLLSTCYKPKFELEPYLRDTPAQISVSNSDSIDCASRILKCLCADDERPLVLNLASSHFPGGAVESGVIAQEEALFRRTNYHHHLNTDRVRYPLGDLDVVVNNNVWVVKDNELFDCVPYKLDFIACAGVQNPSTVAGKLSPPDVKLTSNKIRAIFQAALATNHRFLVLGALGCGAYHNPPKHLAEIFKHVLYEEKYIYAFEYVEFAVLGKTVGGGVNTKAFMEVFKDVSVTPVDPQTHQNTAKTKPPLTTVTTTTGTTDDEPSTSSTVIPKYNSTELRKAYKDTIERSKAGQASAEVTPENLFITFYSEKLVTLLAAPPVKHKGRITVSNRDSLESAQLMVQQNTSLRPLVLNMANSEIPGGAAATGAVTQESLLFARSNYALHLTEERAKYPLQDLQVVVTSQVAVLKDIELEALPNPYFVDFIACTPVQEPGLVGGHLSPKDQDTLRKKVITILAAAVETGHQHLVLGALGCGSHANPPGDVAAVFKKLLVDDQYSTHFQHIDFAILATSPTAAKTLQLFREAFSD